MPSSILTIKMFSFTLNNATCYSTIECGKLILTFPSHPLSPNKKLLFYTLILW